jgi:uncharacterized protein (TIGR00730 family)
MPQRNVTVYCASSQQCAPLYHEAAARLGSALATAGFGVVYGGSVMGSMGRLADAALAGGAPVTGVLPRFMGELEWGHQGLTELRLVDTMHERKALMLELGSAVAALPGGCGTFEELMEAITWKRLGLYTGPVVIVNVNGFFDPCVELLERAVRERFMTEKHRAMWCVVNEPEEVVAAIADSPGWDLEARSFAVLK